MSKQEVLNHRQQHLTDTTHNNSNYNNNDLVWSFRTPRYNQTFGIRRKTINPLNALGLQLVVEQFQETVMILEVTTGEVQISFRCLEVTPLKKGRLTLDVVVLKDFSSPLTVNAELVLWTCCSSCELSSRFCGMTTSDTNWASWILFTACDRCQPYAVFVRWFLWRNQTNFLLWNSLV